MAGWWDVFLDGNYGAMTAGPTGVLLSLLVAFVIGQVIGWIYMLTHSSLSYSQTFVSSLVVIPVIVSLMMVLMSGSLVIAFGLLAVFAVVRFRNVLKDTRDTTFILWTIVEGMAAGTMRHTTAVIGALFVSVIIMYLWVTAFGAKHRYDAVLTLRMEGNVAEAIQRLTAVLRRYTFRCHLTAERAVPDAGTVCSYHLSLRDPSRSADLQSELLKMPNYHDVSLYLSELESEI